MFGRVIPRVRGPLIRGLSVRDLFVRAADVEESYKCEFGTFVFTRLVL